MMYLHMLVIVLLSPLLLIQGKWTRYKTPILPEPTGTREGLLGEGQPLSILIIGDSAAAGVGVQTQDDALLGQTLLRLKEEYQIRYRLHANTGDNTADCIAKLSQIQEEKFDVVITSLGVNDLTGGCLLDEFGRRQRALVELCKQQFGANQIMLTGMPPVGEFPALPQPLRWCLGTRAKYFDRVILDVSEQLNVEYLKIDLTERNDAMSLDGFHPGAPVYEEWAETVTKLIRVSDN
ncbi:MAG: SGNH/GDSL hydrolase family protein [Pseudomonadota bacterium]